jgi:hypothetical protein
MTLRTCLRCDWQGETREAACPNCGVPLYVVVVPAPGEARMPAASPPEEPIRVAESPSSVAPSGVPPESDPSMLSTGGSGSTSRSARSAGVLILAGLVLILGMGTWLRTHEEGVGPGASTDGVPLGTTASDASSIQVITPSPTTTPEGIGPIALAIGRQRVIVDGVAFSFEATTAGWERFGDISINKSIEGPQGAEAMIFWTSFPDGDHADPCDNLLHPRGGPPGPSAAGLAAAVAEAPGTDLVEGPSDDTLGGRAAKHVVLTVREELRCDPGFFYMWKDVEAGALWPHTAVGVTIDVWIVDVSGTRLFIEAETTRQAGRELEREVQQIVGSIRFERAMSADYVLDLDTGTTTTLPGAIIRSLRTTGEGDEEGSQYAASPDGSRIAYVAPGDEGISQIFVADLDGSGVRQVTHDPIGAGWPTWSPDGTMIAYEGYGAGYGMGDVRNLFVLEVASGESRQIGDAASLGGGLQFTPDGSSLIYTAGTFQVPELQTAPVAGGESTIRFGRGHGGMVDAAGGSMSPDGSLVTMMGSAGDGGAFRFVARADGTELRQIVGRGSNPAGTWSPDGSRIVCSDGDVGIIVIDIATGSSSVVAEGSAAIWLDDHTLLVEV